MRLCAIALPRRCPTAGESMLVADTSGGTQQGNRRGREGSNRVTFHTVAATSLPVIPVP